MKNKIKLLGIIAIIALIGLSFAGCDTGGGGDSGGAGGGGGGSVPSTVTADKKVYESTDGTNIYKLEISDATARAAYSPANGDNYILTITVIATKKSTTSKGTVTVNNETSFVLSPSNKPAATFTVNVTTTTSGSVIISSITGSIILTDNSTMAQPTLNPSKKYNTFSLKAEKFDNIQAWSNDDISLSELTDFEPQKGDKLEFMISGEMDEPLEWFSVGLSSRQPIDDNPEHYNYRWLGGKETYIEKLDAPFTNNTFVIEILDNPIAPKTVKFGIRNILWQKGDGDNSDWVHETGSVVSDSEVGAVKATIRNFEISLIGITRK